jgi:hypothetical protein
MYCFHKFKIWYVELKIQSRLLKNLEALLGGKEYLVGTVSSVAGLVCSSYAG